MKKKILISMIVSFVLLAGVVSAATNWGKFEGNNIVRLLINGKEAKVKDVPAVMLNDRTMVPIYMLKDAGLDISWDGKTSTVNVNNKGVSSNDDDAKTLKIYYLFSDMYKQLNDLGDSLSDFSGSLSLAYQGISLYNNRDTLDKQYDQLEFLRSTYNDLSDSYNSSRTDFNSYNLKTQTTLDVFNYYYDAIDYYETAILKLDDYYYDKSVKNFNAYLDNSSNGFDTTYEGLYLVSPAYNEIFRKILSY